MCNRLAKKYRGGCRYLASLTEGPRSTLLAHACIYMCVFTRAEDVEQKRVRCVGYAL